LWVWPFVVSALAQSARVPAATPKLLFDLQTASDCLHMGRETLARRR
jgi:hypothetical protein